LSISEKILSVCTRTQEHWWLLKKVFRKLKSNVKINSRIVDDDSNRDNKLPVYLTNIFIVNMFLWVMLNFLFV